MKETVKYNQGIFYQMRNRPISKWKKGGLTYEDILAVKLYIFGETIKHTEERITDLEDLQQAIEHYRFLYKYNLA